MSDYSERKHEELAGRVAVSAFSNITDSIIDRHTAVKVIAITLTAEVMGIAMSILAKDDLSEALDGSDGDLWIYAAAAIFANGFLIVFPVYFLFAKKWPHPGSGFMIWPLSILAGLLNIAVFFALLTFSSR